MRTEKVTEQDRFGQVVHFVAVCPIDPDVSDADIARVAGRCHHLQDPAVVDDVFLERRLEPTWPSAAGVKMRRVSDEWLDLRISHASFCEVSVIQGQCQAWCV